MNADQLKILCKGLEDAMTGLETMIQFSKTQADRIAELEKLLEHSVGSDCREMRYIQDIENKDARIAELEKQTKPTPDGLIDPKSYYIGYADGKKTPQTKTENTWTSCSACGQKVTEDLIHTCSPQTKPLSDEEIGEIYWNLYADDWTEEDIKFARAIEERHGIK